jgi:lysocardiolipin and lysophospholipid acyltransferase
MISFHRSFSSCSEQKCIRSQKYAAEHGLPILKNVLLPKTKGFCACLQELGGSLNAGFPLNSGFISI